MLGVRMFAFQTNRVSIFKALGGRVCVCKKERKKGEKIPVKKLKKLLYVTGQQSQMDRMNHGLGDQLVLAIIMKTFFRLH
jgi:hypothetical protein